MLLCLLACGVSAGPQRAATLPPASEREPQAGGEAAPVDRGKCANVKQARRTHVGMLPTMSLDDDFSDAAYEAQRILADVRSSLCAQGAARPTLDSELAAVLGEVGIEIFDVQLTNDEMTTAAVLVRAQTDQELCFRLLVEQNSADERWLIRGSARELIAQP